MLRQTVPTTEPDSPGGGGSGRPAGTTGPGNDGDEERDPRALARHACSTDVSDWPSIMRGGRAAGQSASDPRQAGPLYETMRTPGVEPGPLAGQDPKFERPGRQQTRPYHTRLSVLGLRIGSGVPFSLQLSPVPHRFGTGVMPAVAWSAGPGRLTPPSTNSTGLVEQRPGSAGSASSTRKFQGTVGAVSNNTNYSPRNVWSRPNKSWAAPTTRS
jgi:hypothetical protein